MSKMLVVLVTKGDSRIGQRIGPILEGEAKVVRFWNLPDLGEANGGEQPLVLVAHANEQNFIVDDDRHPKEYRSGKQVAEALTARGLNPGKFRVCLIAGCKAAERSGKSGLYVQVGKVLNIPVVAATTKVGLQADGDRINLRPDDDGEWKVYYPDNDEVFKLSSDRAVDIRRTLSEGPFDLK